MYLTRQVLCTILIILLTICSIKTERCKDELELPKNLDVIPEFQSSREIHLHGRYRIYLNSDTNITFTITELSYFRVYLSPFDTDLDLYLYQDRNTVLDFSYFFYAEEIITQKLSLGSYTLQVHPLFSSSVTDPSNCQSILFEMAISPATFVTTRYANYLECPPQQFLPQVIDFALPVHFSTISLDNSNSRQYNVYGTYNANIYSVVYAQKYSFQLNAKPGTTPLFNVNAVLGYDFLTGGSTRLLLAPGDMTECNSMYTNCIHGENLAINKNAIQTTLGPGNYSLWIIDKTHRRFSDLNPCIPITFELDIKQNPHKENFLSCHAESIPTDLADVGFLDDTGYLHYRENVFIDLSNRTHTTEFSLQVRSLFRIFIEAHRVDIDIELRNSTEGSKGIVARTLRSDSIDESIMVQLEPDTPYTIIYRYYTTLDAQFCETFLLEIAIEPALYYYQIDFCEGHSTEAPTISLSPLSVNYIFPKSSYHYHFLTNNHIEEIFSIPVSSPVEMLFTASVGSSFLSGLSLTLESNQTSSIVAKSDMNSMTLSLVLLPGRTYTLKLIVEPSQLTPNLSSFPPCVFYDLEITTVSPLGHVSCDAPSLPQDLSGPQYLGTSNRVHTEQQYLVPRVLGEFETTESMTFTVRRKSMFRAYTEISSGVYIGFSITKNGTSIPHTVRDEEVEKISAILEAGYIYVFTVLYSADFEVLPECTLWHLEFEIAPIPLNYVPHNCMFESLPPATLPLFGNELELSETYAFTQDSTPFSCSTTFTVDNYVFFRALVAYDFVWSDLSLRLLINGSLVVFGINKYNKNEIGGIELSPGVYTLEIFEPEALETDELKSCTNFHLTVGITKQFEKDGNIKDNEFTGCTGLFLPTTFDSISYLSEISGNMMHFSGNVLIDTSAASTTFRYRNILFHITVPSTFRLFMPPPTSTIYPTLVQLNPDTGDPMGSNIASDENMNVRLDIGYYRLRFLMIASDACPTFYLEIVIVPNDAIQRLTSRTCSIPILPGELSLNTNVSLPFNRPMTTGKFDLSFHITQETLFTAQLSYIFLTGNLYFTLSGSNIISPVLSAAKDRRWVAHAALDMKFFDMVLYPGSYILHMEDFGPYYNDTSSQCTMSQLNYLLDVGNAPPYYCDDLDAFPTDLYSVMGGSTQYGGPQSLTDGSIRISGTRFLIAEKGARNNILFKVYNTSWVRFWAYFDTGNDIDFMLYQNASRLRTIDSSLGVSNYESRVTLLEPQQEDYLLEINVFARSDRICDYASFEFALETNYTVHSSSRCPDPLPVPILPPEQIHIYDTTIDLFYSSFAFTQEYISTHSTDNWSYWTVVYEMKIIVHDNSASIIVILGYDFIVADFTMIFYYEKGGYLEAETGAPDNEDSFVDFTSKISVEVPPGNHTLRIQEKIFKSRVMLPGECHNFQFDFLGQPIGPISNISHVTSVVPPSGSELDASRPLIIEISFSHPVGPVVPNTAYLLLSWINSRSTVFLRGMNVTIKPNNVFFSNSRTTLTTIFEDLTFNSTYTLIVNITQFTDGNGTPFARYNELHKYATLSCNCGGHGHCSQTSLHIKECICDPPYSGVECKSCIIGYHRENIICIKNIPCTNNSCNGHGSCDDKSGYPICKCDPGYESTSTNYCSRCRAGYIGYPNCVEKDDDRLIRCTATLLPTDLNGAIYLGDDGSVHLQDDYFLDLEHYAHTMTWTLNHDSYFRVYTEPHQIDIDIYLWKINSDVLWDRTLIESVYFFNTEEIIFQFLKSGRYSLEFSYIDNSNTLSCPTANIELEIEPAPVVVEEARRVQTECTSVPKLPTDNLGKIPTTGYTYAPTVFTLDSNVANQNKIFSSIKFSVDSVKNKVALFEAEVQYRFLMSQVAMSIVNLDSNTSDTGVVGFNSYNSHHLHRNLYGNQYLLNFYLPKALNTSVVPCLVFSFSLSVRYVAEDQDIFNCDYPLLPTSLNSAPFRGSRIHVYDQFLLSPANNVIKFNVTSPSSIRVAGLSKTHLSFFLESSNNRLAVSNSYGQMVYQYLLTDTEYQITFQYTETNTEENFCPTVELEIAILTNNQLMGIQQDFSCPQGSVGVLPSIPSRLTLPYYFTPPSNVSSVETIYYTYGAIFGDIVQEYTFTVPEEAYIDVGIASHFMSANLELTLVLPGDVETVVDSQSGQEDYNYIQLELKPGQYTLKIRQYIHTSSVLIPCIPFNFFMTVVSISAHTEKPCSDLLPLPKTLDSLRYLSMDHSLLIQSDNWAVPLVSTFYGTHETTFTVPYRSLFRIYVEEHTIDIDIRLLNKTKGELGKGDNKFGEESIVMSLDPGTYIIEFRFFNWKFDTRCNSFNMEIGVAPLDELVIVPTCPDNAKVLWPTLPEIIESADLPVFLNDRWSTNLVEYHYQQVDHNKWGEPIHSAPIIFKTTFDIHVELGYNFLVGDLVLKLSSTTMAKPIIGKNEYHRNVINMKNLPAGNYTLTIYEPTSNDLSVIGCISFTFIFYADVSGNADSKVTQPVFPLPDLNSVANLRYTDMIHIQGEYSFFKNNSKTETISFKLAKQSLVHVKTPVLSPIAINFQESDPHSHPSSRSILPPGDHTIFFYPSGDWLNQALSSYVELVVLPETALDTKINNLPCKNLPQWVPPDIKLRPTDGFYQFSEPKAVLTETQLRSVNDLYTMPFTLKFQSTVSARVQFDFTFTNIILLIRRTDFTDNPEQYAMDSFNTNDINTILLPGNYTLILRQDHPWTDTRSLPCITFYFHIAIGVNDYIPCFSYATFPWDLNSADGGSLPYGGPIKLDALNLWYNKFQLTHGGSRLITSFQLKKTSLVSYFVVEHTWAEVTVVIVRRNSSAVGSAITPVMSELTGFQSTGLYRLEPGNYEIQIDYDSMTYDSCSYFGFGFTIESVSSLANYLEQQCQKTPQEPLPTTITKPNLYISTSLSDKMIRTHSNSEGTFNYNITFEITDDNTNLDVSLSYSPLTSFFQFNLYKLLAMENENKWFIIYYGEWETVNVDSRYLGLTYTIDNPFSKGQYILSINQPPIPIPDPSRQACYPIEFNFELTAPSTRPTLYYIEPPAGSGFDPTRDLHVELRFSEAVYDLSRNKVTRNEPTALKNGVYLVRVDDNSEIEPMDVTIPDDAPAVDDLTRWSVVFSNEEFKYGVTYSLKLRGLQNAESLSFYIPYDHTYSMEPFDPTCGGFGTYNEATKICDCNANTHRAPPQCDECITGYEFDKKHLNCVPSVPMGICSTESCGCLPNITKCSPIGTCTNQGGLAITCKCNYQQYTGARCDSCAPGYRDDYPYCTAICVPPCAHGTCSGVTGTCQCEGNFRGPTCSECEPGYSGDMCENTTRKTVLVVAAVGAVVGAVVIIGLLVWKCALRPKEDSSGYMDPHMEMELQGGRRIAGNDREEGVKLETEEESEGDRFIQD